MMSDVLEESYVDRIRTFLIAVDDSSAQVLTYVGTKFGGRSDVAMSTKHSSEKRSNAPYGSWKRPTETWRRRRLKEQEAQC